VRRLHATPRLQPTFKTAFHLASTQARYALERQAWTEAAAIVPRTPAALEWDQYPWAEAIAWFARGLGAAHLGRMGDAADAAGHLARLEAAAGASGEDLFARNIGMLRLELSGWIAHAGKRDATALERLREAAELEAATPKHAVTPAPTLPALELLGDLQMERKHPAEALAAYRSALELYPRRLNALAGAARAARAAGDDSLAHALYRQLLDLARGGTRPALGEARVLLGERP